MRVWFLWYCRVKGRFVSRKKMGAEGGDDGGGSDDEDNEGNHGHADDEDGEKDPSAMSSSMASAKPEDVPSSAAVPMYGSAPYTMVPSSSLPISTGSIAHPMVQVPPMLHAVGSAGGVNAAVPLTASGLPYHEPLMPPPSTMPMHHMPVTHATTSNSSALPQSHPAAPGGVPTEMLSSHQGPPRPAH